MRSNSASEASMSAPIESSAAIGKSSRVCSVVNATTVPIEIAEPAVDELWPANQ